MERTEMKKRMRTVGPGVMYIAAIVMVFCALFWVTLFFYGYLADDVGTPAMSEGSVPPPLTY
jgi:multisubunit Na+/H+ antiporter MnhB subunit